MNNVLSIPAFNQWFAGLSKGEQEDVVFVYRLLQEKGVLLGAPHSSALNGTRYPIRELRCRGGRSPIRVTYAYDPNRDAILLLGGHKGEKSDLYKWLIPQSEKVWVQYLAAIELEKRKK